MTAPRTRNHDDFAELVAGHVLHALDEHDERRLADHLPGCAACLRLRDDLADTAAELAHAVSRPTPAGLDAAIFDGIRADAAPVARLRPGRSRGWAPLAAAAGLLVLAAGVTTWRTGGTGRPPTDLASAEAALRCHDDATCDPVALSSPDRAVRAMLLLRPTEASLLVDGLPANPTDREIYVLWQQGPGGGMRAIATFDVPATQGVVGPFPLTTTARADALLAVSRETGRTAPRQPSTPIVTSR